MMFVVDDVTPCGSVTSHDGHYWRSGFLWHKSQYCSGKMKIEHIAQNAFVIRDLPIMKQETANAIRARIEDQLGYGGYKIPKAVEPHKCSFKVTTPEIATTGVGFKCDACDEELSIARDHIKDVLMHHKTYDDYWFWNAILNREETLPVDLCGDPLPHTPHMIKTGHEYSAKCAGWDTSW